MRACLFTLQREPALPRILANKTSRLPTPAARSRRAWVPGFRVCAQRGCSRQGVPLPHRIAGSLPAGLQAAVQGRAPRGCGVWASRCTHRPRNPPGPLPSLGLCFPHAGQANWLGRVWALRPVCRVCTCPAGPACGCLGVERAWRPELAGVQGLPRGGPQTRPRGGHLHLGAAQPALLARLPPSRSLQPCMPWGWAVSPRELPGCAVCWDSSGPWVLFVLLPHSCCGGCLPPSSANSQSTERAWMRGLLQEDFPNAPGVAGAFRTLPVPLSVLAPLWRLS